MSHVPLPVRVAMGLLVTAMEQASKLPEQLAGLPVAAASHAVQAGMRVQQRVTELAIKGDQMFSLLREFEDTPAWARFDEDEGDAAATHTSPRSPTTDPRPEDTRPEDSRPEQASPAPVALPAYDELSPAQLRSMLRELSLPQLAELLEYERDHQDRPAFVRMLSNRITTVRSHMTESS
ncbi:MAG: lipid droplet-associated protein [Pseudonocardiaceae bacterium]